MNNILMVYAYALESADGLKTHLLDSWSLLPEKCWITDLVKVFLYKPEHAESCGDVGPKFKVPVNRHHFMDFAAKSMSWLQEEVQPCNPKLIVTLGEEVAQALSGEIGAPPDNLLTRDISRIEALGNYPILFVQHPDACRRFVKW